MNTNSRKKSLNDIKYIEKGWGYELWLENKPEYCSKILVVEKDKRFSMHYHKLKDETFFLQDGMVEIAYYENPLIDHLLTKWEDLYKLDGISIDIEVLNPGDSFHIPVGMRHSVKGLFSSKIFEFSTQHFDSDSYRILKGD